MVELIELAIKLKTKHTIPWEQLQKQNIPYHENSSKNKTYHKGNNKFTEQSYKGKVKTHKYIHRKNQSTIGKLYHENSSRNKTYHTMRTVPKTKHNIPREQLQNRNIPYHENSSKNKTYHTMRTAPKINRKIIETTKSFSCSGHRSTQSIVFSIK
jgi:hypothetical protein